MRLPIPRAARLALEAVCLIGAALLAFNFLKESKRGPKSSLGRQDRPAAPVPGERLGTTASRDARRYAPLLECAASADPVVPAEIRAARQVTA